MLTHRIRDAAIVSLIFVAMETIAIMVIFSPAAIAHEAPPAAVDLVRIGEDRILLSIEVDPAGFLARSDGLDHDTYAQLAKGELLDQLSQRPELLGSAIDAVGAGGAVNMVVKGMDGTGRFELLALDASPHQVVSLSPSEALGPSLFRILVPETGAVLQTHFIQPGASLELASVAYPETGFAATFAEYVIAGFDHILPKGLDHILFVIGLFLLSPTLRPLTVQVGLFTIAHTMTLGLAASGWIAVPSSVVEPLIAASIAFVAVENILRTSMSRWRPLVVFGFGLLHGLGFASVLSEFGLPNHQFAVALIAFNIGVEIGQIVVLLGCFLAAGLFFAKPWYRAAVAIPGSFLLALVGVFWFFERVAGALA